MSYNPFEKAIGQPLEASDLYSLVGRVAEGYYVEYKSEFPSSAKISHGIASFANTYGGWYLVGVTADKQTNVAESLPGVDLSQYPDPIAKVRDIARDHIAPAPLLLPQLVPLKADRGILAVHVPESDDTPHITRDGRVYRRMAGRSDPVHETDRLELDRLMDRRRTALQRFDRFCQDDRVFSQEEASRSWLEIYLSPYPTGVVFRPDILRAEYLDELLTSSRGPLQISLSDEARATVTGSFNHAQTSVGSVILRQVEPKHLAWNSLHLELFVDGRARAFLPLPRFELGPSLNNIESAEVAAFLGQLRDSNAAATVALLTLVDLRETWRVLAYLVAFYLVWLEGLGWEGALQGKLRLTNVWRCVPFFDADAWVEYARKYGLPTCSRGSMLHPPRAGSHSV